MRSIALAAVIFGATVALRVSVGAQGDLLFDALDHPAIAYRSEAHDRIADLARRVDTGAARLTFDTGGSGYLRSLLDALQIPVESQMVVFSKTSLQAPIITPQNPRAIYFTDDAMVAWPRGGFIEMAALDPQRGIQFYMLQQQNAAAPHIIAAERTRPGICLNCHHAFATGDVPGLLVKSVSADERGRIQPQIANFLTDDRSPLEERWAGWYVTGSVAGARHLGRAADSLDGQFDLTGYLAPYSDVAALLVFDHQARVTNLITRAAWQVRMAAADGGDVAAFARQAAAELVDALLFVDAAPLPRGVTSTSGFARVFSARGPLDSQGRSLHQLDLNTRLLRYPCSYMIYSAAFDALPVAAKDAVYQRLWTVLSGGDTGARYRSLSAVDRRAIVDILRATKSDLPASFK